MRGTVLETKRELMRLDAAKIDFNYSSFDRFVKALMLGFLTGEAAAQQCQSMKNEKCRKPMAGLVEAFGTYAADKSVSWFNSYPVDRYPIAPGVAIPINPSGFWAEGGRLKLLWVQKWKGRTLDPLQRAIFHTILAQRVFVGDDFGGAELEWVDLRAQTKRGDRDVEVLSRGDFGLLTAKELKDHLDILLQAFTEFAAERAARKEAQRRDQPPVDAPLFDQLRPDSGGVG